MAQLDPENTKIDVEIFITAEEAQVEQVLELLRKRVRKLHDLPKATENGRANQWEITFSTRDNHFLPRHAKACLNEALVEGRREVVLTFNPI